MAMLSDYTDRKKILNKLSELKETKNLDKSFDATDKGIEKMILDYLENVEMSDEMIEAMNILKEAKISDKNIILITKALIKNANNYIKEARKVKREYKDSCDELTQDIGSLVIDSVRAKGLKETSLVFEGFGNVSAKMNSTPCIDNKDKAIQRMASDTNLRQYLKIDEKKLAKSDDWKGIDGISEKEEYDVSITTARK